MSTQGLITILLSTIGILIMSWVTIASMWVREKFSTHSKLLDQHDERISMIEKISQEEKQERHEMLDILRTMKNAG